VCAQIQVHLRLKWRIDSQLKKGWKSPVQETNIFVLPSSSSQQWPHSHQRSCLGLSEQHVFAGNRQPLPKATVFRSAGDGNRSYSYWWCLLLSLAPTVGKAQSRWHKAVC